MSADRATSGPDTPADVSDNVARECVEYIRSNTIKNEPEFLMMVPSYATGYLDDADFYNSGVTIGTSSSGKTHVMKQLEALWEQVQDHLYQTTGGTDKSMIYDEDWDDAVIASLDELQKLPDPLIEFLKGVHGGDASFSYRTVEGSVKEGFETEVIEREAKPYWFLYAQWDPDFEMWNRLLKVPVHESEPKNRAVGKMAFDHTNVSVDDGTDIEYGFDYSEGVEALQTHVASLENGPGYVIIPNGTDGFEWDCWSIVEPIFQHSRSEVNRIYHMVANTIRGWTKCNQHAREVRSIDHPEYGRQDALVAHPQDLANVLTCRKALLATTHELDDKKRAICEAIDVKGGETREVEGVQPIREYLKETDAPEVKESELTNIIEDLSDNYLVRVHPDAGSDREDIYEFMGWDELGFARVDEFPHLFDGTGPFDPVYDPITGEPFLEAHQQMRSELETDASDLMGRADADTKTTASGSRSGGSVQETPSSSGAGDLSSFGGGSSQSVDLGPVETAVLDVAGDLLDGERIYDLTDVPPEVFVGLVPPNEPDQQFEVEGSLLDPDHDVWSQPDRADDWVTNRAQARREIKDAIRVLIDERVIRFETVHERTDDDRVKDATLSIVDPR